MEDLRAGQKKERPVPNAIAILERCAAKQDWIAYIDEQYIDFSNITKNQKDRYPVSSIKYYETDYGAEAFEDPDSGIRFIFYKHFHTYDGSEDYGEVMNIQAYVGTEEPEINYMTGPNGEKIPVGFTGHFPGPDGWAVDIAGSFVRLDG